MTPRAARLLAITYAVLCHGTFALAVTTMAVSLLGGMQLGLGRLHGTAAWVANVCLLLQFPIGHSLLLTSRGRRIVAHLAPAPFGADLVTTTYVVIASIQVTLVFLLWSPSGVVWWTATGLMRWVLIAAFASAWMLLARSMFDASLAVQTGYLGWTSVFRGRKPEYGPMPTRGLFAFSRQPIYLSFSLTLVTVPAWSPDQLLIASAWILYCVLGPLHKEAIFARRYGDAFARYQGRVAYWLPRIPRRETDHLP